jgi:hypothetical protein
MKILAEKYETRVMVSVPLGFCPRMAREYLHDAQRVRQWCDIGGPNLTRTFMEEWLPFADSHGLQVVMNNRAPSSLPFPCQPIAYPYLTRMRGPSPVRYPGICKIRVHSGSYTHFLGWIIVSDIVHISDPEMGI